MSDSELSYFGLNFFVVGLIRYRTKGLYSDKFLSDIGLGYIDVGYRISATKIFDVAPTYAIRVEYFQGSRMKQQLQKRDFCNPVK
jgi:hypothetical protein